MGTLKRYTDALSRAIEAAEEFDYDDRDREDEIEMGDNLRVLESHYRGEYCYHRAQRILDAEERKEEDDGVKEQASRPTFQQALDQINEACEKAEELEINEMRARFSQRKGEMLFH